MNRVLLLRFGAIGNALAGVPAIRALRQAWPDAKLILVADPVTIELLAPCPWLDEIVRYHHKGPEAFGTGYTKFIARLRKLEPTHAIHFRRYLRSELIGMFSGARERVGFGTEARLQFLTRRVQYDEGMNVVELNLRLVRALGIAADDRRLEYWPARESRRVDELIGLARGAGPLAVIHPAGSTQRNKLWPGFGPLGRWLRENLDARVVYLGSGAERGLVEETAASLTPAALTAIGLPLPEAAELIRRADLFCGTDSGPAHLADAVGTPGAIIYAPHKHIAAQLSKWKPEGCNYLAFTPANDCATCGRHPCPADAARACAADIAVEKVGEGMRSLLSCRP